MTKKVAFVSMKGGVGKTTIAVNLPIAGHTVPFESMRGGGAE